MHSFGLLTTLSAIFLLAPLVAAHICIQNPPPLFVDSERSERRSPLKPDGSDFPCKMKEGDQLPTSGGMDMAVGSPQTLAFESNTTAVHGGGSCQISITYETDKDKVRDPQNWYVILSIQGGCPTNGDMNIGSAPAVTGMHQCDDEGTDGINCLNKFGFAIPEGFKDGHATLAWTWFNRRGAREMYMNCAPIEISGGSGTGLNQYPSLFTANIGNGCSTTEGSNLVFPNPGSDLTSGAGSPKPGSAAVAASPPSAPPSGDCGSQSRGGSDAKEPKEQDPSLTGGDTTTQRQQSDTPEFGAAGLSSTLASRSTTAVSGSSSQPLATLDIKLNQKAKVDQYDAPSSDTSLSGETAAYEAPSSQPSDYAPAKPSPEGDTQPTSHGGVKWVTITSTVTGEQHASQTVQPELSSDTNAGYGGSGGASASGASASGPDPANSAYGSASSAGSGTPGSQSSGGPDSGSCADGGVSCSTPGQIVCIDSTSFGLCDIDNCAVPQSLAAGTQCKDGTVGAADAPQSSKKRRDKALRGKHAGLAR